MTPTTIDRPERTDRGRGGSGREPDKPGRKNSRRRVSVLARRVSGPVGGRLATPRPPRTATTPRPQTGRPSRDATPRPLRDATPSRRAVKRPLAAGSAAAIGVRAAAYARSLPDHSLIDRLVRGRAWIPVLGVMLVGLVAMQVEILKAGASMGRAIERTSALTSRNEQLRMSVASLADDQRIERLATGMGMVTTLPEQVGFLPAHAGGDVHKAIAAIHAPDASSFLAAQQALLSAATAANTASSTSAADTTSATDTTSITGTTAATATTASGYGDTSSAGG